MAPVRVLLADDSEDFLQAASGFLSRDARVTVVGHAREGREACRLVEALNPDLVLMDLKMPLMDGLEATAAIKARRPTLRVFIVTLHEHTAWRRAAERAGADGFISKAGFARSVTDVVEAALGGWRS